MVWKVEYGKKTLKQLDKLDPKISKRIIRFVDERLIPIENLRSIGQAMVGPAYGDYWKYRVGDYRLIARIEDERVLIVIVKIGNRRDVYR